jgi:hypothetical protein
MTPERILREAVELSGANDDWREWPNTREAVVGVCMIVADRHNLATRDELAAVAGVPNGRWGHVFGRCTQAVKHGWTIKAGRAPRWTGRRFPEVVAQLESVLGLVATDLSDVANALAEIRGTMKRRVINAPELSRRPALRGLAVDLDRAIEEMAAACRRGKGTRVDVTV